MVVGQSPYRRSTVCGSEFVPSFNFGAVPNCEWIFPVMSHLPTGMHIQVGNCYFILVSSFNRKAHPNYELVYYVFSPTYTIADTNLTHFTWLTVGFMWYTYVTRVFMGPTDTNPWGPPGATANPRFLISQSTTLLVGTLGVLQVAASTAATSATVPITHPGRFRLGLYGDTWWHNNWGPPVISWFITS